MSHLYFKNVEEGDQTEACHTVCAAKNSLLKQVQAVCQADPALRARMNHLDEFEVKGHLPRFNIPSDQSVAVTPLSTYCVLGKYPIDDSC